MKLFEQKFKAFLKEKVNPRSEKEDGSLMDYLVNNPSQLEEYGIDIEPIESDLAAYVADVVGDALPMDESNLTFDIINDYYPELVDSFFMKYNEGQNWLWVIGYILLYRGFFNDNNGLSRYGFQATAADNKYSNWYEDYFKTESMSDPDEAAGLLAKWSGKDVDTDDISDELEQANEIDSYPIEIDKGFGIHAQANDGEYPSLYVSPNTLDYEDSEGAYLYAEGNDDYRGSVEEFHPRKNMQPMFSDAASKIEAFLNKLG